jgi:tetratricopeptide (TPR) repeat protein
MTGTRWPGPAAAGLLAAAVLTGCFAFPPPARAADEPSESSWVGKRIMTKQPGVKIRSPGKDGKEVEETLTLATYRVHKDDGKRIQVRHRGVAGWLAKDDALPLEEAVRYFTERIRTDPKDAYAYARRGLAWKERGELDQALKDCSEAVRLDPKSSSWLNNRGLVLKDQGKFDQAIRDFDQAIRIDPKNALAYNNRGLAYTDQGKYDRAVQDFGEAVRLDPKFSTAYSNRAIALAAQKEYGRAIRDYEEAIKADPENVLPYNNLAYLLATCPEDKYRDGKRAVASARRACELTGWKDPGLIDTLAVAHAEAGQYEEAVKWVKKAMESSAKFSKEEMEQLKKQLALFQEGKPYREK